MLRAPSPFEFFRPGTDNRVQARPWAQPDRASELSSLIPGHLGKEGEVISLGRHATLLRWFCA